MDMGVSQANCPVFLQNIVHYLWDLLGINGAQANICNEDMKCCIHTYG